LKYGDLDVATGVRNERDACSRDLEFIRTRHRGRS
jgi:hypothetical protein